MRIGIPRELKDNEWRVGMTPSGVAQLAAGNHRVVVEHAAGVGCGFGDEDYARAGAQIGSAADAWGCDLVVKIKEPIAREFHHFAGQVLFAYLHLAGAERGLTAALLASGVTAIAYETVEDARGALPLLAPMSAIAGSMAPLVGANYLQRPRGGRGTLLGTVLGRPHGRVTIVGDGMVGSHACDAAAALGAQVDVFGITPARAAEFEQRGRHVRYRESTPANLAAALPESDLLIGAVLVRGAAAPHVVTEAMVRSMPAGAVAVDVSIDQGGCIATSRPTTHTDPVFRAHDVLHYCVTNMPGAYPRTATIELAAMTLPYIERLAARGAAAALEDPLFARGVNVHAGRITYAAVAESLGMLDVFEALPAAAQ